MESLAACERCAGIVSNPMLALVYLSPYSAHISCWRAHLAYKDFDQLIRGFFWLRQYH